MSIPEVEVDSTHRIPYILSSEGCLVWPSLRFLILEAVSPAPKRQRSLAIVAFCFFVEK